MGFLVFIAPYVLGLLSFIVARRGRLVRPASEEDLGLSIAVSVGVTTALMMFGLILAVTDAFASGDVTSLNGWAYVLSGLIVVSAVYWFRAVRRGPAGLLCLRWYAAVLCLIWFGWWFVADMSHTLFGLWLSLVGCLLMIVGATGEAKARSYGTTWATLTALLTCRLHIFEFGEPRCNKCGYLLIGLTTSRCPECGEEFDRRDHPDIGLISM